MEYSIDPLAPLGVPWSIVRIRRSEIVPPSVDIVTTMGSPLVTPGAIRRHRQIVTPSPPIDIETGMGVPWQTSLRRHRVTYPPPPVIEVTPSMGMPWQPSLRRYRVTYIVPPPVTTTSMGLPTPWTLRRRRSPPTPIEETVILGMPWSWIPRRRIIPKPGFGASATLLSTSILTGHGSLLIPGAAALGALSTLVATAGLKYSASVALTSVSVLTGTGASSYIIPVAASLGSVSTFTGTGTYTNPGSGASVTLSSFSTLVGAGTLVYQGAVTHSAVSTLTATGSLAYQAKATLVTTSTLTATGNLAYHGIVTSTSVSTLTGQGTLIYKGGAVLSSTSTLLGTSSIYTSLPAWVRTPVLNYRMIISSLETIPFYLVVSSDHKSPALGLQPIVQFSSAGKPFKPTEGLVHEIGNGWYGVTPTSRDILGIAPLLLYVDPPVLGVDPCTVRIEIVPLSGVVPLRVGIARYPLTFYMSRLDHITPYPGLRPTVQIRKPGGDFDAPDGLIKEIGHGWYMCSPDVTDVDTVGALILEARATGADATYEIYDVMGSALVDEIDRYTLALLMIRTMLINSGLFSEATCVISLERQPFSAPSIPSVWINPGSTGFDSELEAGGSRYTLLVSPTFTLNVVVRRMQDIEVHDKNWLTHVKRGAYPIIWKIINLLAGQFVYSVAGDLLTTRSLHPIQIGNPYRYNNDPMIAVVPIMFTTNVQIDIHNPLPYIAS